MTSRREVRVDDYLFDQLDALLPEERSPQGTPSVTDFLAYELPPLIERLALDYEAITLSVPKSDLRVLVTAGMLVDHIAIYTILDPTDTIVILGLEVDL